MAIQITIDAITSGTPPYNVWVTDNCGNAGVSQYINTFSTSAFTFTLPSVFETYPIYYVKIIDANGCNYCVSPDLVGCNVFVGYWDGNSYYKYNVISDTSEGPLSLVITPMFDNSSMANTEDKMWFLSSTGVTELDITIDPFTNTYSREIAINLNVNNQIFAIDNNNLLVLATNTGTSTTHIYNALITGTTASTTNLIEIVGSLSGSPGIRDMKLSTENKVIVIGENTGSTYLQQYDYVSGGTLEVEISLSGISNVASIVESNDQFYILNNSNEVYQINLTAPYLITFEKTSTTPIGFGRTSQRYGCITQKFT